MGAASSGMGSCSLPLTGSPGTASLPSFHSASAASMDSSPCSACQSSPRDADSSSLMDLTRACRWCPGARAAPAATRRTSSRCSFGPLPFTVRGERRSDLVLDVDRVRALEPLDGVYRRIPCGAQPTVRVRVARTQPLEGPVGPGDESEPVGVGPQHLDVAVYPADPQCSAVADLAVLDDRERHLDLVRLLIRAEHDRVPQPDERVRLVRDAVDHGAEDPVPTDVHPVAAEVLHGGYLHSVAPP